MAHHSDLANLLSLPRGQGSWGFDEARQKITLRHNWNGRAFIERADTGAACLLKRDRRRRDLDVREGLQGDGTLGGLLETWVATYSIGKKAGTVLNYGWAIDNLTNRLGVDTFVGDLTVTMIETMLADLVNEGLGHSSIQNIRGALDFGVRRDLMPADVREKLRVAETPALPPRPRSARWFTLEDYQEVRDYLARNGGTRNAMFLTMLYCGLRPGEALGLRWEYVDLDKAVLRVEGTIQRHGEHRHHYSQVLKTDHRHRQAHRAIPMPQALVGVLRELQGNAEPTTATVPQVDGPPLPAEGFVFVEDRGRMKGHLSTDDAQLRYALMIAAEVGVRRVPPNGYRHTFASVLRHLRVPYEEIARLMGHLNASMIVETYGHSLETLTPANVDRLLASLNRPNEGDGPCLPVG